MLQSFIVYGFTALTLYLLSKNATKREYYLYQSSRKKLSLWNSEHILLLTIFALVVGMRYNVGVDYLTYLEEYLNLQNDRNTIRDSFEPGFLFITKLFAKLGIHYTFYFALWGIMQLGFILYAVKNHKYLIPYICLYIMLGPFFLTWMNGIRQTVICCFFVYISKFIYERKLIKYVICILLASLIHKSAMILLPLYLLGRISPKWDNKKINFLLLFICIIVGLTPTWFSFTSSIANILSFLDYDAYSDNISYWTEEFSVMAWGPSRIGLLLVEMSIIWYYPLARKFYQYDKALDYYFIFFFIGVLAYNLFANTSYIFIRPIMYFQIFEIPLFAYIIYFLKVTKRIFPKFIISLIAYTYIFIEIIKVGYFFYTPDEKSLYKFFFNYCI